MGFRFGCAVMKEEATVAAYSRRIDIFAVTTAEIVCTAFAPDSSARILLSQSNWVHDANGMASDKSIQEQAAGCSSRIATQPPPHPRLVRTEARCCTCDRG